MSRLFLLGFLVCVISTAVAGIASAAERMFFIDFNNGRDDADGLTAQTAFKHAPGDPQAGGNCKALELKGGDIVLFKGGVAYRGTINAQSGSPNNPVIYDGNAAGQFGQGKAIIDGSEAIREWKRCASADEASGNANWRQIYYATITLPAQTNAGGEAVRDKGADDYALTINLVQDGKLLELSRDPNPNDPFFLDELESMREMRQPLPATAGDVTTVINPDVFNQPNKDAWDGAYMEVWLRPNWVHNHKVLEYDPAAHQIKVEKFKGEQYPGDRGKFAMVNHVRLIDRGGEFALAAGERETRRVYLWPAQADPKGPAGTVTYSTRQNGFIVDGKSNVEIRNFVIEKQGGEAAVAISVKSNAADIVLRNNEIRFLNSVNRGGSISIAGSRVLVDGNSVHHNRRLRGIAASGAQIIVSHNALEKNGGTGIGFFGVKEGKIVGNTVSDHAGVHANALTVYADSSDVLVEGNRVVSSRVCLTLQDGENITIQNNIFDRGVSGSALAIWPGKKMRNVKVYHNLMLKSTDSDLNYLAGIFTNAKPETIEGLEVKNNIIDGLTGPLDGQTFENNLYLSWGLFQKDQKLAKGEIIESDLSKVFIDPAKHDYRLKADSPAIGAGANVGVEKDFAGTPRAGDKIDIGPYQHSGR